MSDTNVTLFDELKDAAIQAANASLKEKAPKVKALLEMEAKKIAETAVSIGTMYMGGTITKQRALEHLNMQKESFKTVLLTAEEIGLDAAQDTVKEVLSKLLPILAKVGIALL